MFWVALCVHVAFGLPALNRAAPPLAADSIEVRVSTKKPSFTADEQPTFTVSFHNKSRDYINLYNGDAYWDWGIRFEGAKRAHGQGDWQMGFDKLGYLPMSHVQVKAGETHYVDVDLNDSACVFEFDYVGVAKHLTSPIRHLIPGHYWMQLTVTLKNPFGPGYSEWTGPGVANSIEFDVMPAPMRKPTAEELAAWNRGIDTVAKIFDEPGGLWMNGASPTLDLSQTASAEEVVARAVSRSSLGSKAYRVRLARDLPGPMKMKAVYVTVGKKDWVLVFFWEGMWWSRFYPA